MKGFDLQRNFYEFTILSNLDKHLKNINLNIILPFIASLTIEQFSTDDWDRMTVSVFMLYIEFWDIFP